jgi:hypothetical protein
MPYMHPHRPAEPPTKVRRTKAQARPARNLQAMVGTPTKGRGQVQPRYRGR